MKVVKGGREALERQIVDELFKPESVTAELRDKVKHLGPIGQLSFVPTEILPSEPESLRQSGIAQVEDQS